MKRDKEQKAADPSGEGSPGEEGSPKMTPQMMGAMVNHSYNEGMTAYQRNNLGDAMIWFAQALDALKAIGCNEEMISAILHYSGMIHGLTGKEAQAIGFFEAVANIQQNRNVDAATADALQMTGKAIAVIKYPTAAHRVFKSAQDMYRTLEMKEKFDQTQRELDKLDVGTERSPAASREFTIRVGDKDRNKFVVTTEGAVNWLQFEGFDQTIPVGRVNPWNVIYTGRVKGQGTKAGEGGLFSRLRDKR